ncbi:hypothetical protein [Hyalangium sp.]|uniref:hypothetical protein n=1 Tax=Hyalangium sp. TaxID=2028555 RepID=UPI002D5617A2|nr:hypothetical protein [Hyalangium sp.]HYH95354.1 hypothetical protein [Hyalangium sp.]
MNLSVGLPRMHKEAGERRDFLPALVSFLDRVGVKAIVLEEGYGSGLDVPLAEYLAASSKARTGTYEECLAQDVVVVLRCPDDTTLRKLRPGTVLYSMLHYPTRPHRLELLHELGLRGVSLDGLTDDRGKRLVENLQSVGWNGVQAAFRELARTHRRFRDTGRRPLRVTILGAGAVGGYAARAASRYGDDQLRQAMLAAGVPGIEVSLLDHDVTGIENYMLSRLEHTDLLVDATFRPDPSRPVIPNDWVGALPVHAVMLDLSVDPYDFTTTPAQVKGIEGIPEGNLDQYVFAPEDPVYARMDPRIQTKHRRVALSCYSWPGVNPRECMEVYGTQLEPLLRVALELPLDTLDEKHGRYFERAVARAESTRWHKANR